MDITLNLASSATRQRRRLHYVAVGGLCLNLLLAVANLLLYRASQEDLRMATERLRQRQVAVQHKEDLLATLPQRLSTKDLEDFGARITLYNRIMQGANFSFAHLLFELERAIPPNVTLTEIQPDIDRGGVTLSGTAKTMEDMLRCVERLKERKDFQQVYLLSHGVEKGKASVRFTISLRYGGEAA
jgi:Tfp pilus assembly protein PilN